MVRRWTCRHYSECLEKAAKINARDLSCDGCERYGLPDPVDIAESCARGVIVTRTMEVVMEKEKVEGGGIVSCPKCGVNPAGINKAKHVTPCRECRSKAISEGRMRTKDTEKKDARPQGGREAPALDVGRLTLALNIVQLVLKNHQHDDDAQLVADVYEKLAEANG